MLDEETSPLKVVGEAEFRVPFNIDVTGGDGLQGGETQIFQVPIRHDVKCSSITKTVE